MMEEQFWGLPSFMWEGIFNIAVALGAGLIIAFVTTFYLKKKDEVTRVAGLILEKRVNSYKDVLDFFDNLSQKYQMNNAKEEELYQFLKSLEFDLPHGKLLQYSDAFTSSEKFHSFFKDLELIITTNKLWFDVKVIRHLNLIQAYFAQINALRVMARMIPPPRNQEFTEEDRQKIDELLLLQMAIVLDNEINALLAALEVRLVGSIYKLDLRRPKKALTRNGFLNTDTLFMLNQLRKSVLVKKREDFVHLAIIQAYMIKGEVPTEDDIDRILDTVTVHDD